MLTMTHKEVMELLNDRMDCDFTVVIEKAVAEDALHMPVYLRPWYRASAYRLSVWDDVGNRIAVFRRLVPVNGGSIVYDANEVMDQIVYRGF